MVRDSLSNRNYRRHPRTVRPDPPPGTSRPGRPLPIGPLNELPEILGGERCVPDETTWRSQLDNAGGCSRKVGRLENGCCELQVGRDAQLLQLYKYFLEHPHKQVPAPFFEWVRARDVIGSVSRATTSMSSPDFLRIPKLLITMQSCGTSIDVMVDHTVQGDVMPFKFTNLFLGETTYIGKVERSDESQSVGRVVMDVSKFDEEIKSSQYSNPPIHGFDVNPALVVSMVNITPIVPLMINGYRYGRRGFFKSSPLQFVDLMSLRNGSGRSISPSSFKFELGKDFQNYFEYIPDGYERLLPESLEQANALANEIYMAGNPGASIEFDSSGNSVVLWYRVRYDRGRRTYSVKVSYWPEVALEVSNVEVSWEPPRKSPAPHRKSPAPRV